MNVKDRIREAVNNGVTAKAISAKAEVSYYRLKSIINPKACRGESNFDRFEEARIHEALDSIKNSF